jgi:predicted dehydrogenase
MKGPISRRAWLAGTAALAQAETAAVRLPRKVRLGMIGVESHAGELLGPLRRLPDVELVAVAETDPRALRRFSQARQYTDYRRMLDSEKLDVVGVCNSNGERAAAILAAVERKLHVVAEKPLAIERADLARIKQSVARNGVRLSMLLPMRFSPAYMGLKKLVDAGEAGEIAQIAAQKSYKLGERPNWYRKRSTYGGTIPWIGVHMVDLMRWSSGREFTEAVSYQNRVGFPELGEMENVTATLFRLDNGGVAALRMDYLRPETAPTHGDDRLRLAGTKGVVEYQAAAGLTVMTAGQKPEVISDLPPARSLFIDFLESVYSGKPSGLELPDIYRVNEIVLLARESAEAHRIIAL